MDPLAGILEGPRARGAFLLRSILDPPWSLRIVDRAPLTIIAIVEGDAWVTSDDGPSIALGPGDIAIARGPDPYTIADDPSSPPHVIVHPGQRCETVNGEDLAEAMTLGVRTWGNSERGANVLLTGTYEREGEVSQRLLDALPPLAVLPAAEWDSPLLTLLADEITREEPGQEAVLDRILDLLLIAALRAWFARPDSGAPAWYRAHADPVVGRAIALLVNNPAHPWTVANLAAETGVSRAALARRFHLLVGEPPMTFLTSWRLAMAADLLCEPGSTVGGVAATVGYGSPFALSVAFKRVRGVSPRDHRAAVAG